MKQFLAMLLGDQQPLPFASLVFYALVGAFVSILLQANHRDPRSIRSPVHFSWSFLLSDNVKRIVTGLILIVLALRFTKQIFGLDINDFWALAIGLANDKIAQFLKDKTNILGK
jgi:ABC-type methionine transport system permease subunit